MYTEKSGTEAYYPLLADEIGLKSTEDFIGLN